MVHVYLAETNIWRTGNGIITEWRDFDGVFLN